VFKPRAKPNGVGVILCVSAGFESGKDLLKFIHPLATRDLLDRGYTVFAVMHSSQPRYTVPEIVEDMHRAVRFIKTKAKKYDIDPDKLGIAGASSGGHLSLMMGCDYRPGDPKAEDPVERESSKVAAVACFFPPTDFIEFDKPDLPPHREVFRSLFDVRVFNPKTNKLEGITAEKRTELGRLCSPLYCATKAAAPTFIIHGDKDDLVPLKQSRDLIEKLKKCDVVCELDVKKGMGHSALAASRHLPQITDWFDKHLKK
jgi:acetyl esterase/lipase